MDKMKIYKNVIVGSNENDIFVKVLLPLQYIKGGYYYEQCINKKPIDKIIKGIKSGAKMLKFLKEYRII